MYCVHTHTYIYDIYVYIVPCVHIQYVHAHTHTHSHIYIYIHTNKHVYAAIGSHYFLYFPLWSLCQYMCDMRHTRTCTYIYDHICIRMYLHCIGGTMSADSPGAISCPGGEGKERWGWYPFWSENWEAGRPVHFPCETSRSEKCGGSALFFWRVDSTMDVRSRFLYFFGTNHANQAVFVSGFSADGTTLADKFAGRICLLACFAVPRV